MFQDRLVRDLARIVHEPGLAHEPGTSKIYFYFKEIYIYLNTYKSHLSEIKILDLSIIYLYRWPPFSSI